MECPEAEALIALASGELPEARRASVANHAARCTPCQAALEALLPAQPAGVGADPMASTPDARSTPPETRMASEDDRPSRRPRLAVGARVDRYVIEAVLGQGGMGVVYRARDPELGRAVAIKVLQRETGGGERLRREAQALAKLSHPNVVAIHDVGTHDGRPFIAMALVEGDNLRQWLAPGRARRAVLDVLLAAGRGIAAAHEAGLIHRDLKPDNIFVARSGQVLVGDFGLARGIDGAEREACDPAADDELSPVLTAPGTVLGTPAYMAPEHAAGRATMASDQFSFCVTAWEAFTRARPFAGATPGAFLDNVRRGCVIEPRSDLALPPRIDAALRRGLAADPALRFPSMLALLSALEPAEDRAPAPARATVQSAAPTRRRRAGGVAALAAITAITTSASTSDTCGDPAAMPEIKDMIGFPGGTFRMGRTRQEVDSECTRLGAACRRDLLDREQPAREVTLSPFYLDVHEATNEEIARWLTTLKPSLKVRADEDQQVPRWVHFDGVRLLDLMPPHAGITRRPDGDFVARPGHEHEPAGQITWDGAWLYCKWRGKRLPTEAEWEHAARGHTARRFPWGEREPGCGEVAWGRDEGMPCAWRSGPPGPLAVGTAPLDRTPEGIRDLGGNVMEWVADQFIKPYLPECGDCVDPMTAAKAPVPLHADIRVLRGGSWAHGWHMSRSTMRARWNRTEVMVNAGVRCATR